MSMLCDETEFKKQYHECDTGYCAECDITNQILWGIDTLMGFPRDVQNKILFPIIRSSYEHYENFYLQVQEIACAQQAEERGPLDPAYCKECGKILEEGGKCTNLCQWLS